MKFTTAVVIAMIAVVNGHAKVPSSPSPVPEVLPSPVAEGNTATIVSDSTSSSASGDNVVAVGADTTSGSAAAAGESEAFAGAGVGLAGGIAVSDASPAI